VNHRARKGSKRWIQVAVNDKASILTAAILESLGLPGRMKIEWSSPVGPHYREHRDLAALGVMKAPSLRVDLDSFWPRRGPVWDALGRTDHGDLLFVEAKAHIAEAASPRSKATPASYALIQKSLEQVRAWLAPRSRADWTGTFFQYANRLAHLWFYRVQNRLPAHLVFVYFLNARDVGGPARREEWDAALTLLHSALGLSRRHSLRRFVHDVFINVDALT